MKDMKDRSIAVEIRDDLLDIHFATGMGKIGLTISVGTSRRFF